MVSPRTDRKVNSAVKSLGPRFLDYANEADTFDTPAAVLNGLHDIVAGCLDLKVLAAVRFPLRTSDWNSLRLGHTVFLHSEAPKGWWDEWSATIQWNLPLAYLIAQSSLAPHTWEHTRAVLGSVGADAWDHDMALKYGMHDGFMCPVGGRWLIAFWSSKKLSHTLTPTVRVMVFSAASLAAIRLEQLTGPDADRLGTFIRVKPQELAILRFLSFGRTVEEIAKLLAIDEDTVETSLIKTQMKLNARNQTHAVAEAIRQNMIS